jgi:hypothetical protein
MEDELITTHSYQHLLSYRSQSLPTCLVNLRMPEIHDQNEPILGPRVPNFVLERVINDDELSLLPGSVRQTIDCNDRCTYLLGYIDDKQTHRTSPNLEY